MNKSKKSWNLQDIRELQSQALETLKGQYDNNRPVDLDELKRINTVANMTGKFVAGVLAQIKFNNYLGKEKEDFLK